MRRQYLDILRDRAVDADVRALIDTGWRWLGTALAPRSGRTLVGPALGTLLVTYRCDLRCTVCDLPTRAAARSRAGDRELDTEAMKRVLRDFKAIGTAGVGVTGGEPMLRRDVLELMSYGSRLGMHMHLNTDGFQVVDQAEAIRRTGVRSVNVSLDGPTPEVHDAARNKVGSFDTVMGALGALRKARGKRRFPRVTAVTVLTASNVGRAGEVVRVAREAGADRVGVIPVHDFGHGAPEADPLEVAAGISSLREMHARGWLDNSTAYLDLLPRAFRGEPSPLKCYAPWSSVVVDCYGDVYPCFPLMEKREPVGQIPLAALWRSKVYRDKRSELAACQACLWNCHTELNLALPQRRATRLAVQRGTAS